MRTKIQRIIVVILLLATFLSGCTIGDTEYVLDLSHIGRDEILSVNGEKCSLKEAKLYLCNYQNLYGKEYGVNLWDYDFSTEEVPATLEEYVKDITLLQLSNIMCMNQLAKEMEITLTEKEESKVKHTAEEYYESLSSYELDYMGISKKDVIGFYEKYAIAEKLYRHLTQGVNEEVSLDEARVIRIQQIYVTSLDKARTVQKKLEKGEDFSNVAGAYNEEKQIEIVVARGGLSEILEEVAFGLDNGEQSGLIKEKEGYYFINCLSKNVEELTEKNKGTIIAKRRKEQFDDVFLAFVEKSELEVNQNEWDKVMVDTTGNIKTDCFFALYDDHFTKED